MINTLCHSIYRLKEQMITIDKEFYSSPYYFLLRDKGNKYSLYFSVEGTLTEARKKDEVVHFEHFVHQWPGRGGLGPDAVHDRAQLLQEFLVDVVHKLSL